MAPKSRPVDPSGPVLRGGLFANYDVSYALAIRATGGKESHLFPITYIGQNKDTRPFKTILAYKGMQFLKRTYDLTSDFHGTVPSEPKPELSYSSGLSWALSGICRFHTSGPVLEIELIETETLRRSVVYPSKDPAFLSLPSGHYTMYYRLPYGGLDSDVSIKIEQLGLLDKLGVYITKAASLGFDIKRWAQAFRSFKSSKNRAVGINLSPPTPVIDWSHFPELPEQIPVPVPPETAVSIIIPTKTRYDLLESCLKSLEMIEGVSYEIIIIDNGATHPEMLALLSRASLKPHVRVYRHDIPFNFSKLCNLGAAEAAYPILLFLNDDVEALDGTWLAAMCGHVLRPDVGVVGARLLYPSGDLQHAGIAVNMVPAPGHPWRHSSEIVWRSHPYLSTAREVDAVTGACLMITKSFFVTLGGFDLDRFAVTLNDVDLCLRASIKGKINIYEPCATLIHKELQTRVSDDSNIELVRHSIEVMLFNDKFKTSLYKFKTLPLFLKRDSELIEPV